MSYQPEERYWTDYLRIALPVVGLLLMLGLFWFWATSLIGNDKNSPAPTATANVAVNLQTPSVTATAAVAATVPAAQPTATTPAGAAGNPTPPPANTTAGANTTTGQPTTAPTLPTATATTAAASGFAADQIVLVTEDVRMRSSSSLSSDSNVLKTLTVDTQLTVVSGPETGDPNPVTGTTDWYKVRDSQGTTGYVSADYLKASP